MHHSPSSTPFAPSFLKVSLRRRAHHAWFVILLSVLFAAVSASAKLGLVEQVQLGNPSNASQNSTDHQHYLIQRTVQALDYNDSRGEPNWASWDLTADDLGDSGRSSSFYKDTSLPSSFYQVPPTSYTSSGYDRGHLCPSADRTLDDGINKMVFYMTNILPQAPDNNQGPWASFEAYCRTLAEDGNELLIICGGSNYTGATVANGTVDIPGTTWKIAIVVPSGSGSAISRIGYATRIISLEMPNANGIRTTPWARFISTAAHIESTTGLTFFSSLPPNVAEVLRARVDGTSAPLLTSYNTGSAFPGTEIILSGRGFTASSKVMFNGTSASFTVDSDSQIRTTVPSGASDGPISIITPGGLATNSRIFDIVFRPVLSSFSPTIASVGEPVILQGSAFLSASSVTFNGRPATFTIDSDSQITALVPAGAVSGQIQIITPNGSTTSADSFTLRPPPDFDTWVSLHFTSAERAEPSVSGPKENPSGDGMSNLAKYAFGLDPHFANAATAITYQATSTDGLITLILTHRKNHTAADVTFAYETSSDLVTWSTLQSPETTTVPLDDQTDIVTLQMTSPNPRLYLRIRIDR